MHLDAQLTAGKLRVCADGHEQDKQNSGPKSCRAATHISKMIIYGAGRLPCRFLLQPG